MDDFFEDLKKKHSKSLDESFKAYDEFNKEENLNYFFNNIFAPAQDDLYQTIKAELDKTFKDDGAKTAGKIKAVKKAVSTGLKKYFDGTHPSLTKIIADLGLSEDEQYEFLTKMYDEHVGAGKIKDVESIRVIEGLARDKRVTVGHIKRHVYTQKPRHAEAALKMLKAKHINHHFSKYHPAEIAAYLKPRLEKEGFEVEDKLGFATADTGELLGLRANIIKKEGHPYLRKKKEAKK